MYVIYITIFYIFGLLEPVFGSLAATHLMVTRVGPCYDVSSTRIEVSEFSVITMTYNSMLNGALNISQDIDDGWTVKATMQKCQDIRNTDTCDYFKSFKLVTNGCLEGPEEEQEMCAMLFHYTEPRLTCPLQAGSYKLLNYPILTEDNYLAVYEAKISTSVFGYTFRLEGFGKKAQRILCVEAYLQLLYMREHNWLETKHAQDTPAHASMEHDKNISDE